MNSDYEHECQDLLAKQRSNAEAYDRALLTLSSGFLGFSLLFIKDVVPLAGADHVWLLRVGWLFLALTVGWTLWGFLYGQVAIKQALDAADRHYNKGDPKAFDESVKIGRRIDFNNVLAGIFFVVGVAALMLFVNLNIGGEKDARQAQSDPKTAVQRISAGKPVPERTTAPATCTQQLAC